MKRSAGPRPSKCAPSMLSTDTVWVRVGGGGVRHCALARLGAHRHDAGRQLQDSTTTTTAAAASPLATTTAATNFSRCPCTTLRPRPITGTAALAVNPRSDSPPDSRFLAASASELLLVPAVVPSPRGRHRQPLLMPQRLAPLAPLPPSEQIVAGGSTVDRNAPVSPGAHHRLLCVRRGRVPRDGALPSTTAVMSSSSSFHRRHPLTLLLLLLLFCSPPQAFTVRTKPTTRLGGRRRYLRRMTTHWVSLGNETA